MLAPSAAISSVSLPPRLPTPMPARLTRSLGDSPPHAFAGNAPSATAPAPAARRNSLRFMSKYVFDLIGPLFSPRRMWRPELKDMPVAGQGWDDHGYNGSLRP